MIAGNQDLCVHVDGLQKRNIGGIRAEYHISQSGTSTSYNNSYEKKGIDNPPYILEHIQMSVYTLSRIFTVRLALMLMDF